MEINEGREHRPTGGAVISVTGNRSAVVDGCDGIVDYDEERVVLRTGRLTVRITGRRLRLTKLTQSSAMIEGVIMGLEYSY
ncbi:YabP/YqfC family sporulation protein [Acutalibacter sp. 1XD8-36]|uniref:YabP/YqfC family sporulation protein n=1 Tax=Acutalibacter sp. 1XD8-36 TaxID=2320852 RepID=UPI00141340FF|nr:YabP/YqfC family sporulation protein [Acutalibacter sp. 1XD8-36]NBJ88712.1 sporulation protein [Acutalibacter sp. 1XD8-36]